MWSWCEVDVSEIAPTSGAGVPGVQPRIYALFWETRLFSSEKLFRPAFSSIHAPSCAWSRYSGGLLENDKCGGDAAAYELAAQRRREVDATLVYVAQDDPRPSSAPV